MSLGRGLGGDSEHVLSIDPETFLRLSCRDRLELFERATAEALCELERAVGASYGGTLWSPKYWGEAVPGVRRRFRTPRKCVAVTLDLCGGAVDRPDGCDYRYVEYFVRNAVPATVFVTKRWIDMHEADFVALCAQPLFAIENHGTLHRPCGVGGKSAYNIKGTSGLCDIECEVKSAAAAISKAARRPPSLFRAGTGFYDEIAVSFINKLGYQVVGFDVLGDAGASFTKEEVTSAILSASSGSIVILHMNWPRRDCAYGALVAFDELRARGYEFVELRGVHLE